MRRSFWQKRRRNDEGIDTGAALPEATEGGHPATTVIHTSAKAVRMTELRLRMLRSAHARVAATACFVHGVDWAVANNAAP